MIEYSHHCPPIKASELSQCPPSAPAFLSSLRHMHNSQYCEASPAKSHDPRKTRRLRQLMLSTPRILLYFFFAFILGALATLVFSFSFFHLSPMSSMHDDDV